MPDIAAPPPVERFRRYGIIAWSLIGVLIIAGSALWALTRVRQVFPPIVLALILIYLLNPIVSRLERHGMRRLYGTAIAYLLLIGLAGAAMSFIAPTIVDQGQTFARHFPQTSRKIDRFSSDVSHTLQRRFGIHVDPTNVLGRKSLARQLGRRLGGLLKGAAQTLALLGVGFVLSFYLLIDLPRFQRAALRLIPPDRRNEWREVGNGVSTAMSGFFRGQLLVAFIVGVMASVALRIVGLPYWLVIGLIAGFFNIVPMIGALVGAVPAVLVAVTFKPPIYILWTGIALIIVQQIDNHLISPNVMRWTVRLHPVTVMLSLIAGAALGGFWGMLVTVPIVASVKMIAGHFWKTRVPWGEEVFEEGDKMEGVGPEQIPTAGRSGRRCYHLRPVHQEGRRDRPYEAPATGSLERRC
jgi:predicted PurR-regulated permease PerM